MRAKLVRIWIFSFLLLLGIEIFYKVIGTLFEIQNSLFYVLSAFVTGYISAYYYINNLDKVLLEDKKDDTFRNT